MTFYMYMHKVNWRCLVCTTCVCESRRTPSADGHVFSVLAAISRKTQCPKIIVLFRIVVRVIGVDFEMNLCVN